MQPSPVPIQDIASLNTAARTEPVSSPSGDTEPRRGLLPRVLLFADRPGKKKLNSATIPGCSSAVSLTELEKLHSNLKSNRRSWLARDQWRRLHRFSTLQHKVAERVKQQRNRYRLHERLLLLWYSRRDPPKSDARFGHSWLTDPLARWRTLWRTVGVLMLLAHVIGSGVSSWVAFRCDVSPTCDLSERKCPSVWEWLMMPFDQLFLLRPGTAYGCRRDLVTEIVAAYVRAFAAVELFLGVLSGAVARRRHAAGRVASGEAVGVADASVPHPPPWSSTVSTRSASPVWLYGTSAGLFGLSLFALDACLVLAPDLRTVPQRVVRVLQTLPLPWAWLASYLPLGTLNSALRAGYAVMLGSAAEGGEGGVGSALDGGDSGWWGQRVEQPASAFCQSVAWCRDNGLVRTVAGYQRLNALPKAPTPIQYLIDRSIAYMLPTQAKRIRALPTIGDILLEGELLQTFVGEFLSSAKALVLVISILKAERVRRGAHALRRERACRQIVYWIRRFVAQRRVKRLQRTHVWSELLRLGSPSEGLRAPPPTPAPCSDSPVVQNERPSRPTGRSLLPAALRDLSPLMTFGNLKRNLRSAPEGLSELTNGPQHWDDLTRDGGQPRPLSQE